LHTGTTRGLPRIESPEDAANELQFNSLLLAPYQVEVLFVLCVLLGGRRKIDSQRKLKEFGLIATLDEMFYRLSWGTNSTTPRRQQRPSSDSGDSSNRSGETVDSSQIDEEVPTGIHGPGCECNPESVLRVQYLRLLHNFCDRDCDNYDPRRLLLSPEERNFIFSDKFHRDATSGQNLEPGLLSKILKAFIHESDDSPYRFWLASCAESYLRGSAPQEQLFAAQSGLLEHLVKDVMSDRLHCAGSLQTAFDLLGELCKGNADVLHLLLRGLDEEGFRRLMSVAVANLVDSNVFIRSLFLSVERIAASRQVQHLHIDSNCSEGHGNDGETEALDASSDQSMLNWTSESGTTSRAYLSHSWWDSVPIQLTPEHNEEQGITRNTASIEMSAVELESDESRPSDWYPSRPHVDYSSLESNSEEGRVSREHTPEAPYLNSSVGHCGWIFSPTARSDDDCNGIEWEFNPDVYLPNTIERLSWFLSVNQARLLRDLLGVVDLRNINHENICCLNTAVVVTIFAYRRQQLPRLLRELRCMNNEEKKRTGSNYSKSKQTDFVVDDAVDRVFIQAMQSFEIDDSIGLDAVDSIGFHMDYVRKHSSLPSIGDRSDVLRNFRELLWFWSEYYTHRGRDRLSLEFSSHLRFQEWNNVVSLLGGDDGSATSLAKSAARLPKSPYRRAPRILDNRLRGY